MPDPTREEIAAVLLRDPADILEFKTTGAGTAVILSNYQKITILSPIPAASAIATNDEASEDDLTLLTGIGHTTAERLQAAGVVSFALLVSTDPAAIKGITNAHASQIKKWQEEAATYKE